MSSSRLRPTTRRRQRFSLGDEDRQTFLVNALFAVIIVIGLLILVGAAGLAYYNANLRPIASVGGVELRPDMQRDLQRLTLVRLQREENRVVQARAADEIDSATAQQKISAIGTRREEASASAEENLIDLVFKSQLAAAAGISVTAEDVAERQAQEFSTVERRHVQVIMVEAETSDGATGPTFAQGRAALDRAEQARAALIAGRPFAEVAAEYNDDESLRDNGDLGPITRANGLEPSLLNRLFELDAGGVSEIIRGDDGKYRFGRVVEVQPGSPDPTLQTEVEQQLSLDRYRQFLEWQIGAERLEHQIEREALDATPVQVRLTHIRLDNVLPDDEIAGDDQDQVHFSEIVYAPNDSMEDAPNLGEGDPAWAAAQAEADAAAAELRAIEDETARLERFRDIAREDSDNESSAADGGDAGSLDQETMQSEVGEVLFEQQHEPESLIGPVKTEAGWYLLWFHERKDPPSQRLEQLKAAIARPNPDWPALVAQFSDDTLNRDDGGEIGWWTQLMLNQVDDGLGDDIFEL
jgi:parvulin-like peptidyl-prolyl isomerase